jgi:hypothetical protein
LPKNFNKLSLFWLLAFLIATLVLVNSHFKSTSNDSKYYTELVVRHHQDNLQEIITTKWGENYWGYDPNSYTLDIFPGQLLMGVAIAKLGIPPEQSLHILGMVFQILSIFILVKIVEYFSEFSFASVLFYSILLTPMAFSYNIRANHELGIMFFSFLSLYSGIRITTSGKWGIAVILSTVMLLWIKGPFFIFGPILSAVGYLLSTQNNKRIWKIILTIFLSLAIAIVSAIYFDRLFYDLTKIHFLKEFWNIQIISRQIPSTSRFSFITLKLYNFYYYLWHYLVYALPWFAFLIVEFFKNRASIMTFLKSRLSLSMLVPATLFLLVFTVNSRHAARYVFPAYYLFSAWTIILILNFSIKFKLFHQNIMSRKIHIIAPGLWLFIFLLHFIQL